MDPGQSHFEKLKTVPHLIDEDPSIITPSSQKRYMDMPWKDFAAMMQKNKEAAEKYEKYQKRKDDNTTDSATDKSISSSPAGTPAVEEGENEGAWDSETGYQDEDHAPLRGQQKQP
ncbi:hypothetical protein BDB00DRAFT_806327 [Zychaea mexicana]|uniref:uncharacterized protein n=1 Tax=Zychaea mexicana TaxID=64656 RepID=UPI0022FF36CB|nr:uncharacterized protein BDB00DRAFT_806327 [Zychaea mexicana]KAI9496994.1 hypothetical protein BDB00DRAFT_806327 [Zychaea mexicana]